MRSIKFFIILIAIAVAILFSAFQTNAIKKSTSVNIDGESNKLLLLSSTNNTEVQKKKGIGVDYVPDEITAIRVAEAIWLPIYGDNIYNKRPFTARLKGSNIWVVEGTLKEGYKGGVPYIEIQKKDCKILKVTHGK